MAAVTVKIEGGEKYKHYLQKIADMKLGVKAGFFGSSTTAAIGDKSVSIPMYAAVNEFGSRDGRIPSRPFMREAAKNNISQWIGKIAQATKGKAADRNAWIGAMVLCGEAMRADIQASIEKGHWKPNAPATIRAKRRKGKVDPEHPLIDTGNMIAAVKYEVIK